LISVTPASEVYEATAISAVVADAADMSDPVRVAGCVKGVDLNTLEHEYTVCPP
jgi:hypothetical protein